jgi:HK97 family phage portal protein
MKIADIIKGFVPIFSGTSNKISVSSFSSLGEYKNILPDFKKYENPSKKICAKILANTIASIPINVMQLVTDPDVSKYPFRKVLKDDHRYKTLHHSPNGYTTSYDFWSTMEYNAQSDGNSYAIIHRFKDGSKVKYKGEENTVILEIVPISMQYRELLPYLNDEGDLIYTFKTKQGKKEFKSSDIIHFKNTSSNGLTGSNPNKDLEEYLTLYFLANRTITNHYERDGKGKIFVKTTVTTGKREELLERMAEFRKQAAGYYKDNKGNTITSDSNEIIPYPALPGNSELQYVPDTQDDTLYLNTIKNADLKIAAYYGIPPHFLNVLEANKNSNLETLQLDFNSLTIQHILRSRRAELEMKLLTEEEREKGLSIEYNAMAIVELDHKTRMSGYESLSKTAFMTPNEVRTLEGMHPIPGGDQHYIFDQFTTLEDIGDTPELNNN